ncbi:group II intron maturase-specific domain-containing protein [Pseudomonas protegens]|uniref:group II intron maturase-specific domain-containing protein n=1 Tax=Pseudomonas protegens TaxID=380021 RepID=UPI0035A8B715
MPGGGRPKQEPSGPECFAPEIRYDLGWFGYFRLANADSFNRLSAWTRRHMHKCFSHQWHSPTLSKMQ